MKEIMTRRISRNISGYYNMITAAKYMGVSRTMIYYWIKRGSLIYREHTLSGKKYFLKYDLDQLKNKLAISPETVKPINMKILKNKK